jgi:hypothetical protein
MSEQQAAEWYWFLNGEIFNGGPEDTREAALAAARLDHPESKISIGKKAEYRPFNWPSHIVDELLDQEACDASEDAGEAADGWPPRISDQEKEAAGEKIAAIMRELVGEPGFWVITDVEEFAPVGAPAKHGEA